jgi:membrane protein YdbS with pleckstrin-like domain
MPEPDVRGGSAGTSAAGDPPVLFSARPEPISFLYRYLLSFTPVVLVILCVLVRGILDSVVLATSRLIPTFTPAPSAVASNVSSAAMGQYMGLMGFSTAGFGDFTTIMILLITPVSIFVLAAVIGGSLRQTAVWTGAALTIVLSSVAAFVLAGSFSFSTAWFVQFLQWIAFLVQPFSILASVLVLGGTEKFRQSIRYTITPDAIEIRGGLLTHVEQTIPHHRIARVIFEQDPIGSRFNYGTVIPRSTASDKEAIPFGWLVGLGQNNSAGPGAGSIGTSRGPLDCLFGIPDPETARQIVEKMMSRPDPPQSPDKQEDRRSSPGH